MKKLAVVLGSLMLVAAMAYSAAAWGPRWDRGGHHMMDSWGYSDSYGPDYNDRRYRSQNPEQTKRLEQWGYSPGYGSHRGQHMRNYGSQTEGRGPMGCWN